MDNLTGKPATAVDAPDNRPDPATAPPETAGPHPSAADNAGNQSPPSEVTSGDTPDSATESSADPSSTRPAPIHWPELAEHAPAVDMGRVSMLSDVNLHVRIELGRTQMLVEDVLKLGEGSVVALDKLAGDPVDIYVNDRLIGHGEVLVLNDNFCVRVNEVLSRDPHRVVT
jgi:flagellar motor switch protein FliN/FliY